MTRVRRRSSCEIRAGRLGVAFALAACQPLSQTRVVYLERCPRSEIAEQRAQADDAAPAFYAAPPALSSRECREVPYDSSAGPRLFYAEDTGDGWLQFRSDLPLGVGERLSGVVDSRFDVAPERMPLEVQVDKVTPSDDGPGYQVRATFPQGMYAPSRVVGPLEGGWGHLIGESGDGRVAQMAEIGTPQLIYQVWLEQGVLQEVQLRCSQSAYVTQLWLVSDKRRCIYSELQRI